MPGGIPIRVPLFITCQRNGCGQVKRVKNLFEQRTIRYCSKRCSALATADRRRAGCAKGGRTAGRLSAQARRRQVLARVAGMTPLQAFQLGYERGLYSKLRQVRRRFELVKKRESAA